MSAQGEVRVPGVEQGRDHRPAPHGTGAQDGGPHDCEPLADNYDQWLRCSQDCWTEYDRCVEPVFGPLN
ncbi:hypothetical protein [Kitasatospora sp. NPDC093679]|uniref:hypothetical protein n=1 Tax=Kitasatospora sp. NPDC093679 TaxID=3154983 RepID=UPI003440A948